jgi:hypothetical protein
MEELAANSMCGSSVTTSPLRLDISSGFLDAEADKRDAHSEVSRDFLNRHVFPKCRKDPFPGKQDAPSKPICLVLLLASKLRMIDCME